MSNILFMYDNLVDSATITATSTGGESTGFPVTNLQHSFRTKVWQTSTGSAKCIFNLGSAQKVSCAALINYDWTSTGPSTLNLEFVASSGFGDAAAHTESLTFAVNPTTNDNNGCIVKTFTSQSYQYIRLNIVSTDTTGWEIGRVFLGTYLEPTDNYRIEYEQNFIDMSRSLQTIGGQEHIDEIEMYRTINFECIPATQTEWEQFQTMCLTVGKKKDLFISFDYDNEKDEMTMYGKFTSIPGMTKNTPLFELPFSFKESR